MSRRDVSPFLKLVRNFLLGRNHTSALRFEPECSTRSPDPPSLPDGPHHKPSANYYYTHDARREIQPPLILHDNVAQIASPAEGAAQPPLTSAKSKTPGKIYSWD